VLRLAGTVGVPDRIVTAWQTVPAGVAGGQIGRAAATGEEVVSADIESAAGWARHRHEARLAGIRSAWSVPFTGTSGVTGVITVLGGDARETSSTWSRFTPDTPPAPWSETACSAS
jgi:hypothetical protein